MTESINLKINVGVPNGPSRSIYRTLKLDAYDKIDITIPADTDNKLVELQPSTEETVEFLLIVSNVYEDTLSYKVNSNAASADTYILDQPLLLIGKGAISIFESVPTKLYFTNATSETEAKDAEIEILVGRNMPVPE